MVDTRLVPGKETPRTAREALQLALTLAVEAGDFGCAAAVLTVLQQLAEPRIAR
jgi:hypothetical protein